MSRADDIAAYLDEDPFGECGPRTPAPRATQLEAPPGRPSKAGLGGPQDRPAPAVPRSWQDQIIQDVKELLGGRIITNYRHRGQSRRGQRHVLRARAEAQGVSALADDPAL